MFDIELNGENYRIGKLSALNQGQLARRISPLVPKAAPAIQAFNALHLAAEARGKDNPVPVDDILNSLGAVSPLADALADLSDDSFEQIVVLCMSVTTRQQGTAWAPVYRGKTPMFSDIEFDVLLPLIVQTIRHNLGNFIVGLLSKASPATQAPAAG